MAAKGQRRRTTKPLTKEKPPPPGALQVLDENRFSLDFISRKIGGKQAMVDFARNCGDAQIKAFVSAWDGLSKIKKKATSLEFVCHQVDIDSSWLYGRISEEMSRLGADCTKLIGAIAAPEVMQKTVNMALTDDGWRDRQMFLKAARIIPTPSHSNQFSLLAFSGAVGIPEQEPEDAEPVEPSTPTGIPSIEESNIADPHGVVDVRPQAD